MATIPLDPGIPLETLGAIIGSWPMPALLESGPGFGESRRWSLLTARPLVVFEAADGAWSIDDLRPGGVVETGLGDAVVAFAEFLNRYRLADPADLTNLDPNTCPFQGGVIGYFGYDLAPSLESLPRKAARDSTLPDFRFALYDTAVVIDHASGTAEVRAFDLIDEPDEHRLARARDWTGRIETSRGVKVSRSRLGPVESDVSRADYLSAVRRCLDYIADGDVFQVNLSQRFSARGQVVPLDLYRKLRARSPAPYAAYLGWADRAIVSASPELFYETRGDRIVTRPIKGTRPRGSSPVQDEALANELAASPKDRAELTMIIDLERNDLGRVCQYGSVRVVEPMAVESFAQVHHLVSTVEGRLRPGVGPVDVIRAMFPGGSITGAPKIRAMEIIDELEPSRRSVYTGAIGYFGRGGVSAFNIAIRTMIAEGDRISYQVGGGIVADSDPLTEYHETLHKGRAMRETLLGAGDGEPPGDEP